MKTIKNIIDGLMLIRLLKKGTLHRAWYEVVKKVMDFAIDVQQQGKPMLTKIAAIDMSTDKVIGDINIVSLWAGVGEANPIERCRHLKRQNEHMKDLLSKCRGKIEIGSDDNLILNINIVLDVFE